MAKAPAPAEKNPLETEANERLKDARSKKSQFLLDLREAYFMTAPHRQRQMSSQATPGAGRIQDSAELQTSLMMELTESFVTEVVNTFMPEAQPWVERGRGMFIPEEAWDKVKDQVRKDDAQIFEAIKASNFYSELPKSYDPDLAIGTCAMWIDQKRPFDPIECLAVPLREFEGNLGPDGRIDDRFVIRHTRNAHVRALLPGITLPEAVAKEVDEQRAKYTEIRWGFWRKWDESDECWQHVVMIKDDLVHQTEMRGEGSCPLIPTRFNPSADWVWGIGPVLKTMPDGRQVDELEARKIEAVGRNINGPIGYPDDTFSNVEQGLEDGMAYPIRPGTEGALKPIYQQIDMQSAVFQHEEMEHRMRKLFYVDFPEQSGDTPPTLGQWLDQMARAQRRIGTPGMSFWREGPAAYFIRFKYLLERAGIIMPLKVDGKSVSARPMNPAQRAAEQQEIATTFQAIQMIGQAWPEEFKAWIDGKESMVAILDKMRVKLLKFRSKDQVEGAIKQIGALMGGQTPGAAPMPQGMPPQ